MLTSNPHILNFPSLILSQSPELGETSEVHIPSHLGSSPQTQTADATHFRLYRIVASQCAPYAHPTLDTSRSPTQYLSAASESSLAEPSPPCTVISSRSSPASTHKVAAGSHRDARLSKHQASSDDHAGSTYHVRPSTALPHIFHLSDMSLPRFILNSPQSRPQSASSRGWPPQRRRLERWNLPLRCLPPRTTHVTSHDFTV